MITFPVVLFFFLLPLYCLCCLYQPATTWHCPCVLGPQLPEFDLGDLEFWNHNLNTSGEHQVGRNLFSQGWTLEDSENPDNEKFVSHNPAFSRSQQTQHLIK